MVAIVAGIALGRHVILLIGIALFAISGVQALGAMRHRGQVGGGRNQRPLR